MHLRTVPGSEEARNQARVAKVIAGIVGRASAVGIIVLALGFLAVGAVAEAVEGLVAASVLFGVGHAETVDVSIREGDLNERR